MDIQKKQKSTIRWHDVGFFSRII